MNENSFGKDNPILQRGPHARPRQPALSDDGRCRCRRRRLPRGLRLRGQERRHGAGTGSAAPAKTAAAAQDLSDTEKVVNWSNWTEYIDTSEDGKSRPTLEAFQKQTGIEVKYTEDYLDNDEFYAKVRPLLEGGKDTGRDIWCSTDWMVARLIRQGYVQKLDLANIPNAKNLDAALKDVEFDPGRGLLPARGRAASPASATTSRRPAARRSRR